MTLKISNPQSFADFKRTIAAMLEQNGRVEISRLAIDHMNFFQDVHPVEIMADSLYQHQQGKLLLEDTYENEMDAFKKIASDLGAQVTINPENGNMILRKA